MSDKLKVLIDLMNAAQATDKLEAAIEANDARQIGAQLYRLRQALENLQTSTGVKLEFMNLKADQDKKRPALCNCEKWVTDGTHHKNCMHARRKQPPAIDITKYSHAWKHAPKGSAAHWQCSKCGELDNNAIPDTGYSCSEADPPQDKSLYICACGKPAVVDGIHCDDCFIKSRAV